MSPMSVPSGAVSLCARGSHKLAPDRNAASRRRMLDVPARAGHFHQGPARQEPGQTLGAIRRVQGAVLGDQDQRRKCDLRQHGREIDSRQIGQGLQHHVLRRPAHLLDVPLLVAGIRRAGLETAAGGLPHPRLEALFLHEVVVVQIGLDAGELVRRRAGRDRAQPLRESMGELERDRAADGLADQVGPIDPEMIHEVSEIIGEAAERPGIAGGRNRGSAEATRVDADGGERAGEPRPAAVPEPRALGVAVMEDYGLGRRPRIGKVVVLVVHDQVAGKLRGRHRLHYLAAARERDHSSTMSALSNTLCGSESLRALAVRRLTTVSNLAACSIGSSEGRAPLKIRSAKRAARRQTSGKFTPKASSPPTSAYSRNPTLGNRCRSASAARREACAMKSASSYTATASARAFVICAKAPSKSSALFAKICTTARSTVRAVRAIASNVTTLPTFVAFIRTATRFTLGSASFSISMRLAFTSGKEKVEPVTLAPGRARLCTRPVATASPAIATMIGMVVVAAFAARAPGEPCVRMTSTFRRTSSAARIGSRV